MPNIPLIEEPEQLPEAFDLERLSDPVSSYSRAALMIYLGSALAPRYFDSLPSELESEGFSLPTFSAETIGEANTEVTASEIFRNYSRERTFARLLDNPLELANRSYAIVSSLTD